MKISIGADHRGFSLKTNIIQHFDEHEWLDVGTYTDQRTDYPLFARKVCQDLLTGVADCGVLLCGTGNGIAMAANRHKGIYAAIAWTADIARLAKEHDNANVLVLPASCIDPGDALIIVEAWLQAEFYGGRYQQRLEMLDE
jgi:ribose 5-phosphate isomerase B